MGWPTLIVLGVVAAGLPGEDRPTEAGTTLAERLEEVSRPLVGLPYVRSPLGEGNGVDPDPRFRLDAFDCTTFVETVVALGISANEDAAKSRLDLIRYEGEARFERRRHLITSQWAPGLVKDGTLTDITAEVFGTDTRRLKLVMTKERWQKRRIAKKLELDAEHVPVGTFELPYVAADVVERQADRVPPGTVINILRVEVPWSPVVVTHQGLVVLRPGSKRRWVRHASPVLKRVIDEPLASMMKRYQKPRKWPIAGVNFLRVNEASRAESP